MTDMQLKQDVVEELHLDPQVNVAQIGVSVKSQNTQIASRKFAICKHIDLTVGTVEDC